MIRNAVTCDRDDCLAIHVETDDYAAHAFEDHVWTLGWVARPAALIRPGRPDADVTGHLCPACAADRGPVLELGECPVCSGRTVDRDDGAHCHYCQTVTPHRIESLFDEAVWDGRGVVNTKDGPVVGGDDWS